MKAKKKYHKQSNRLKKPKKERFPQIFDPSSKSEKQSRNVPDSMAKYVLGIFKIYIKDSTSQETVLDEHYVLSRL